MPIAVTPASNSGKHRYHLCLDISSVTELEKSFVHIEKVQMVHVAT